MATYNNHKKCLKQLKLIIKLNKTYFVPSSLFEGLFLPPSFLFLTSHHYELTIKCYQERIKGQRAPSHALDWYQVLLWLLLGHVNCTKVIFSPITRLILVSVGLRKLLFSACDSRGNSTVAITIFCICNCLL